MHNGAWETLLRHIPAELQNKFMVVTASGTEIAIQALLRIEKEIVILKGRLCASQDQGRIFFIPFADIDYIGTAMAWSDAQFAEVFDSLKLPAPPHPQAAPGAAAEPEPAAANGNGNGHDSGVRPAIRSEVLERFRSTRGGPSSSANLPRPPQV
jgi:hypothetical protein